jgi:hypothetical protein
LVVVVVAHHERTKLISRSIEYVFLGYSVEHKGYYCWDSVAYRMRISRDVAFDKSRPCYPRRSFLSYFSRMRLPLLCLSLA